MFRILSLFLCLTGTAFGFFRDYPPIRLLPEYAFGYYWNQDEINALFQENEIHVVVEVGSWIGGGSTRHFGELLRESNGTVYAVDTWLGSSTQQLGEQHYQPILDCVYQQFLSNMVHWDLTEIVVPCRMRSVEASIALDVQPDLIYIDGEHTTEAVYEDMCAWYPKLKEGGVFCGDDWTWECVRAAVERFAEERGLMIEAGGNFWRLKQP